MAASQTGTPEIAAALLPMLIATAWDEYANEADPAISILYPEMNDITKIGNKASGTLEGNHTWYTHDKAYGNERLRTGRADFSGGAIYSSSTTQFTVGPPTIPFDDFYSWSEDDAGELERFKMGIAAATKVEQIGEIEKFVDQFSVTPSASVIGRHVAARDLRTLAFMLMGDAQHQNEHADYDTAQLTAYRGHFQTLNAHATAPASLPMSGVNTGFFYWGPKASQTTAMYGQNRTGGASGVALHANQWQHFDDYTTGEHAGWALLSRTMATEMGKVGIVPSQAGEPLLITPEHTAVNLFNYYADRDIPLYVQIVGENDRVGEANAGRNQSIDSLALMTAQNGFVMPTFNMVQYGKIKYGQVRLVMSRVWDDANTQFPVSDLGSTKNIRRSGTGVDALYGGLGYLFYPKLMIPRCLQPMKGKGNEWSKMNLNVRNHLGTYKTDSMWWVREPLATNEYMENKVPMSRLAGVYYPFLCAGGTISGLENGLTRSSHAYNALVTA